MGYHRAGFEVVGVDINPQPHYPFEFHQADALLWPLDQEEWPIRFDVVHASPPCQAHSACNSLHRKNYPDLIDKTIELLTDIGLPWVIENVPGAPLQNPIMLCGAMFFLRVYRHRLFESNVPIVAPPHPRHRRRAGYGYAPGPGGFYTVSGHYADHAGASEAMGIDWMNRKELAQAIPPAYTKWIGDQLLALM